MTVSDSLIDGLRQGLANACGAFATLGRLHAFGNLGGCDVVDREAAARDFVICVDAASQLEDFAHRYYHGRRELVSWPPTIQQARDTIVVRGEVDLAVLKAVTAQVAGSAKGIIARLQAIAEKSVLARPLVVLLRRIKLSLPALAAKGSLYSDLSFKYRDCPARVLRGPIAVHLGPHFRPAYSVADCRPPEFGESIEENVPYFWVMAARETLASHMCALSAVEYDGLPLAFYSDMAKQCWDEARHSLCFVRLAKKTVKDNEGIPYRATGNTNELYEPEEEGFPIPREGNFYEAMLNADLVQRLVLMNQRTEAPAIPLITKRLTSAFCQQHEHVTEFYEFDRIDETSHASIGNRWLRYLIPDESERSKVAEEADLLRGMLILTAFAHHGGGNLAELAERFTR